MLRTTLFRLLSVLLFLGYAPTAMAQRIIGELESNAGFADGVSVADSMMRSGADDDEKKKKKIVPTEVHTWVIDPIYGHRTDVDADTLQHLFQNDDRNEGREGDYNGLSNLGSPRINRIYMLRPEGDEFIFTAPFDQFFTPSSQFRYFNTKSPYMNLTYTWNGNKRTGWDRFRAIYANNVNKRFNFGGMFDYMYGLGFYDRQSTSFMNATGFASYTGRRYDLHFHYTHNYMRWAENGGIEDDLFITRPEDQPQSYSSNEIPVRLASAQNRMETDELFLNHRYHLGFMRQDSDSVGVRETFVPVTTFFHSFSLNKYRKAFSEQNNPVGTYHTYDFIPSVQQSNDRYRLLEIQNTLGVSLREGFNRYAVAGLNAYVGFRHRKYELPQLYNENGETVAGVMTLSGNSVLVGGQIIRTQGRVLHYQARADFVVAGDEAGDLSVEGEADLNLPLLGDTATIAVRGMMANKMPEYYYEHYHSKHAWWDTSLSSIVKTRIEGSLTVPHTRTVLTVGVENVKNFVYLANEGQAVTGTGGVVHYTNNILPRQSSANIQVITARLRQDLKFGPIHLDNVITYQHSTHEDVLPLPTVSTFTNLYLYFVVAKVLRCELGGDMTFFTRYYAPDYSPVVGMFTTQNTAERISIGGYPVMSVYANVLLKKCRFYVRYYHVNQGDSGGFWAPHYPINPSGIHFGISWNFYD